MTSSHILNTYIKIFILIINQKSFFNGARGETRTLTPVKAADFESAASTIPPLGQLIKFYNKYNKTYYFISSI